MVALFVALMFVGFIMLDVIVQKLEVWRAVRVAAMDSLAAAAQARGGYEKWISVPEGVALSQGHAWMLPLQEGAVRAGADSLVARALGAVSRVSLPKVGDHVAAGKPLFALELNGRRVAVFAPVTGRISAVNNKLREQPGLVAQDPYGKGWVCSMEQSRPDASSRPLHVGTKAAAWLEKEVARFEEFLTFRLNPDFALGTTSQDGGVPLPGLLAHFEPDVWAAFEREFLSQK